MESARSLPKLAAPARRALAAANVHTLADVERVGLDHIATLHGIGPNAISALRAALSDWSA
ncbi:hypothetical protein [Microbacterium sp. C7(2022)]|uniref:hypothetical protein n=1 Tax=Microbacterium sp. C7(2022) TaxID=2992759 RepID=UPI00237B48DB|nr:hypothetical protein [Microbacterium sp. C7(2022)]MDE0546137.1 hypothetical protein [Microbacterium sp. C7(2022)]